MIKRCKQNQSLSVSITKSSSSYSASIQQVMQSFFSRLRTQDQSCRQSLLDIFQSYSLYTPFLDDQPSYLSEKNVRQMYSRSQDCILRMLYPKLAIQHGLMIVVQGRIGTSVFIFYFLRVTSLLIYTSSRLLYLTTLAALYFNDFFQDSCIDGFVIDLYSAGTACLCSMNYLASKKNQLNSALSYQISFTCWVAALIADKITQKSVTNCSKVKSFTYAFYLRFWSCLMRRGFRFTSANLGNQSWLTNYSRILRQRRFQQVYYSQLFFQDFDFFSFLGCFSRFGILDGGVFLEQYSIRLLNSFWPVKKFLKSTFTSKNGIK